MMEIMQDKFSPRFKRGALLICLCTNSLSITSNVGGDGWLDFTSIPDPGAPSQQVVGAGALWGPIVTQTRGAWVFFGGQP